MPEETIEYQNPRRSMIEVPITNGSLAHISLSEVVGLLADILHSSDQEMIWSQTCNFFADLGFKHVLYGYSPDSHGAILGSPENYLVLSTLKQDVIREVVREGYYRMSGTFHWALNHPGIASWSLTPQQVGMPDDFAVPPEIAAFFVKHGLVTGCTIGFPQERSRGRAVMGLIAPPTTSQEEVDVKLEAARDLIFTVAATAHRCLSSLPYHPPGRRLTQRQREVLEWVAEGKTSADIAQIMGITPPTVEKHLRLARETLGVETTPHALIKASFLNQVFLAKPAADGALRPTSPWPI